VRTPTMHRRFPIAQFATTPRYASAGCFLDRRSSHFALSSAWSSSPLRGPLFRAKFRTFNFAKVSCKRKAKIAGTQQKVNKKTLCIGSGNYSGARPQKKRAISLSTRFSAFFRLSRAVNPYIQYRTVLMKSQWVFITRHSISSPPLPRHITRGCSCYMGWYPNIIMYKNLAKTPPRASYLAVITAPDPSLGVLLFAQVRH